MLPSALFSDRPTFSVEFFPPRTEAAMQRFRESVKMVQNYPVHFVSVTFGAGGITPEGSVQTVAYIRQHLNCPVVAHITCVGMMKPQIHAFVTQMLALEVTHFLVIRGDLPKNSEVRERIRNQLGPDGKGSRDFPTAKDLLWYMKQEYPGISIGVAGFPEGHPDTPNRLKEMDYLKQKVDAGADYLVTQLCYDSRLLIDFWERCQLAGITIPISAGILPFTSGNRLSRIAELALGSSFPAVFLQQLRGLSDPSKITELGVQWALQQESQLADSGFSGLHWYMLNDADTIHRIFSRLFSPHKWE